VKVRGGGLFMSPGGAGVGSEKVRGGGLFMSPGGGGESMEVRGGGLFLSPGGVGEGVRGESRRFRGSGGGRFGRPEVGDIPIRNRHITAVFNILTWIL